MPMQFPKGKFVSLVKVGEKGQIVIPKGARELFSIQPGDQLLLMADNKARDRAGQHGRSERAGRAVPDGKGGGRRCRS